MIYLKEYPLNTHAWKLIAQLPERVEAVMKQLPADIAQMVLTDLQKHAPKGIDGYPEMLVTRSFKNSDLVAAVGIIAPESAYRYRLRTEDSTDTVIYIEPKTINGQADPGATVLAKYQPWTMETLPYEPSVRVARVVSRKATKGEVARVVLKLKAQLSSIVDELKAVGVTPQRTHKVLLGRSVLRDVGFEVIRREFGIGEVHNAHWRPAIGRARKQYLDDLMKRKFVRWLAVPSERRWQRPTVVPQAKGVVRSFDAFQKLVGGPGG